MSTAPPPVRAPREYGGGRLWQGRVRPIGPNEGGLLCLFFGFSGLHTNCFDAESRGKLRPLSSLVLAAHLPFYLFCAYLDLESVARLLRIATRKY